MTIYFDNAATSFPKPESVYAAVDHTQRFLGASPGRGGHRMALEAGRIIFELREIFADFFGISDAARIAFTANCTEAINIALFGLLRAGDRVVTSTMEHNAVTRPLRALEERGVKVVKVQADSKGFVDPNDLKKACETATSMVVLSHCSNVTGTLQPIEEIGPWCRKEGILFLLDAAQSAGTFLIDVERMGVDLLAAPGHKGLLGPQGTGILYVREGLQLTPLIYGGTGTESNSTLQPDEMPERLESGTMNMPALAGLKAGLEFIIQEGIHVIREHESELVARLIQGLQAVGGIDIYGPLDSRFHGNVVSFSLPSMDLAEISFLLDRNHGIFTRVGLHCAPDAHRTIGTFPKGTIRVSPGYFNTPEEIDYFVSSVSALASHSPV